MKIKEIEIRMCRHKEPVMKDSEMRDGKKSDLEFLVITFHTDEGLSSSTFGFAGRGAEMAGEIANSILNLFYLAETHFIVSNTGMNTEPQIDGGTTHLYIVMDHLILIVGFSHPCKQVNLFISI